MLVVSAGSMPTWRPSPERFSPIFEAPIPALGLGGTRLELLLVLEATYPRHRKASFAQKDIMARTDAIVLGAGIVGTSIALQLAKRGLGVALVDRRGPGEETSHGNAGIIEGNTVFPPAFPASVSALLRIALKRAPEANYHLSHLPQAAPWLMAFWAASRPARLLETARLMRPLFVRA